MDPVLVGHHRVAQADRPSVGGILLEHLKSLSLQWDIGPGDRFLWFTTTGWMMWN